MADPVAELKFDLRRFAKKLEVDVSVVRRKIALDLLRKIAVATPVGDFLGGRLRNNWFMGDGGPPGNVNESPNADSVGNIVGTRGPAFSTSWVVNNLPYVVKIEFGHSRVKRPQGMVRVSLAEIQAELSSELKRL